MSCYRCTTILFPVNGLNSCSTKRTFIYILLSIKLPSLPVSLLYLYVSILWLLFVFSFVIFSDLTLWKLKIFDITKSNSNATTSLSSSSWHVSYTTLHLFEPVCPGLCTLTKSCSVFHPLNNYCIMLVISHVSCVLPQYQQLI